MNKNKLKYVIISSVIVVIIICIILFVILGKKSNRDLDINDVFNKANYSGFKVTKIDKDTVMLNDEVKFGKYTGNMFYERGDNNKRNIFRTKHKIAVTEEDSRPILVQVDAYKTIFKAQSLYYLKINKDDKPIKEEKSSDKKPIVEQIYMDKKVYSLTYKVDNVLYDIKFYMDGDYFICEIIKNL